MYSKRLYKKAFLILWDHELYWLWFLFEKKIRDVSSKESVNTFGEELTYNRGCSSMLGILHEDFSCFLGYKSVF